MPPESIISHGSPLIPALDTNQQQRPDSPQDRTTIPQAESPTSKTNDVDVVDNTIHQSCTSPVDSDDCPLNTTSNVTVVRSKGEDVARNLQLRLFPTLCSGKKQALLIACTYRHVHSNDPNMRTLNYSYKDPENLKRLLLEHGYKDEDITILVDVGDNKETYPTRDNIIKHIKELVNGAQAGDSFFVHFSGHGYQIVAKDDPFEVDGMDEFIYPCDYHVLQQAGMDYYILDNLLRNLLVDPLPEGCRLLALFDCCSSGTVLDLPINDDSEGDEVSVSATEAEETLIGNSLTWKARVSRGRTLQVDERSSLIVGSTLTEEPAEDCLAAYRRVDKPIPPNVLKLRGAAQQERKSRSLLPDPPSSVQDWEGERLTSNQPLVAKPFSVIEKVQAGNQRSQTLPNIYLYARRFQNRGSVHLLPLMNPRGTEGVSEEAIKNAKVPVDTRVINADVLCIASCRDDGRTYETSSGGVLVQAFCAVVDAASRDGRDLMLKDLKRSLRQQLQEMHNTGVESIKDKDPDFKAEEYDAPIPQFSYSHTYVRIQKLHVHTYEANGIDSKGLQLEIHFILMHLHGKALFCVTIFRCILGPSIAILEGVGAPVSSTILGTLAP